MKFQVYIFDSSKPAMKQAKVVAECLDLQAGCASLYGLAQQHRGERVSINLLIKKTKLSSASLMAGISCDLVNLWPALPQLEAEAKSRLAIHQENEKRAAQRIKWLRARGGGGQAFWDALRANTEADKAYQACQFDEVVRLLNLPTEAAA